MFTRCQLVSILHPMNISYKCARKDATHYTTTGAVSPLQEEERKRERSGSDTGAETSVRIALIIIRLVSAEITRKKLRCRVCAKH